MPPLIKTIQIKIWSVELDLAYMGHLLRCSKSLIMIILNKNIKQDLNNSLKTMMIKEAKSNIHYNFKNYSKTIKKYQTPS